MLASSKLTFFSRTFGSLKEVALEDCPRKLCRQLDYHSTLKTPTTILTTYLLVLRIEMALTLPGMADWSVMKRNVARESHN